MEIIQHHYASIQSTQEEAKNQCDQINLLEWHVYSADEQTQGRATHQKKWHSPPGVNVYATFSSLIPKNKPDALFSVSQVAAYALVKTLDTQGVSAKIKWINDVFLDRKKIAGILCETIPSSQYPEYLTLFIGIGLNVNMTEDVSDKVGQSMTSLRMASHGKLFDRREILNILQNTLCADINTLFEKNVNPFQSEINTLMEFIHEPIAFDTQEKDSPILQGIFKGVDSRGRLMLELPDKSLNVFSKGRFIIPKGKLSYGISPIKQPR